MVFGKDDGRRIVRSWPGPGTMDTYYETEDGAVWRNKPALSSVSVTTPSATGQIVNGRIVTR